MKNCTIINIFLFYNVVSLPVLLPFNSSSIVCLSTIPLYLYCLFVYHSTLPLLFACLPFNYSSIVRLPSIRWYTTSLGKFHQVITNFFYKLLVVRCVGQNPLIRWVSYTGSTHRTVTIPKSINRELHKSLYKKTIFNDTDIIIDLL